MAISPEMYAAAGMNMYQNMQPGAPRNGPGGQMSYYGQPFDGNGTSGIQWGFGNAVVGNWWGGIPTGLPPGTSRYEYMIEREKAAKHWMSNAYGVVAMGGASAVGFGAATYAIGNSAPVAFATTWGGRAMQAGVAGLGAVTKSSWLTGLATAGSGVGLSTATTGALSSAAYVGGGIVGGLTGMALIGAATGAGMGWASDLHESHNKYYEIERDLREKGKRLLGFGSSENTDYGVGFSNYQTQRMTNMMDRMATVHGEQAGGIMGATSSKRGFYGAGAYNKRLGELQAMFNVGADSGLLDGQGSYDNVEKTFIKMVDEVDKLAKMLSATKAKVMETMANIKKSGGASSIGDISMTMQNAAIASSVSGMGSDKTLNFMMNSSLQFGQGSVTGAMSQNFAAQAVTMAGAVISKGILSPEELQRAGGNTESLADLFNRYTQTELNDDSMKVYASRFVKADGTVDSARIQRERKAGRAGTWDRQQYLASHSAEFDSRTDRGIARGREVGAAMDKMSQADLMGILEMKTLIDAGGINTALSSEDAIYGQLKQHQNINGFSEAQMRMVAKGVAGGAYAEAGATAKAAGVALKKKAVIDRGNQLLEEKGWQPGFFNGIGAAVDFVGTSLVNRFRAGSAAAADHPGESASWTELSNNYKVMMSETYATRYGSSPADQNAIREAMAQQYKIRTGNEILNTATLKDYEEAFAKTDGYGQRIASGYARLGAKNDEFVIGMQSAEKNPFKDSELVDAGTAGKSGLSVTGFLPQAYYSADKATQGRYLGSAVNRAMGLGMTQIAASDEVAKEMKRLNLSGDSERFAWMSLAGTQGLSVNSDQIKSVFEAIGLDDKGSYDKDTMLAFNEIIGLSMKESALNEDSLLNDTSVFSKFEHVLEGKGGDSERVMKELSSNGKLRREMMSKLYKSGITDQTQILDSLLGQAGAKTSNLMAANTIALKKEKSTDTAHSDFYDMMQGSLTSGKYANFDAYISGDSKIAGPAWADELKEKFKKQGSSGDSRKQMSEMLFTMNNRFEGESTETSTARNTGNIHSVLSQILTIIQPATASQKSGIGSMSDSMSAIATAVTQTGIKVKGRFW